jgi:hypothetical protein
VLINKLNQHVALYHFVTSTLIVSQHNLSAHGILMIYVFDLWGCNFGGEEKVVRFMFALSHLRYFQV